MKEQTMKICQSCAMSVEDTNLQGTNVDGSKNEEYCIYCYKDGKFTVDITMEEMIEGCVPYTSKGNPWPDEETARKSMQELFPKLKRWAV